MKYFAASLLLFIVLMASAAPSQGFSPEELSSCPVCLGDWAPVCASDGHSYWNSECALCFNPSLTITRKGFCPRLDVELEG